MESIIASKLFSFVMLELREGVNHKKEKVLKIYSGNCPECGRYQEYFEFICNMDSMAKTDEEKLIRVQQIEEMIRKVKGGERLDFASIRFGCMQHYPKSKKCCLDMSPSDISRVNGIPISHLYLAVPIS